MADASTDLSDSLNSLRYLVAVPGTFAGLYPDTDDDALTVVLADGFAEAQLMGVFGSKYSVDEDGIVEPGLTQGQVALVVLLAGIRFLRTVLLNTNTAVTYKAGSAEYHTENSASLLRDILADLTAQKNAILANTDSGEGSDAGNVAFYMADQYLARVIADWQSDFSASGGW